MNTVFVSVYEVSLQTSSSNFPYITEQFWCMESNIVTAYNIIYLKNMVIMHFIKKKFN